jgi:hypothetical protein
MEFCRQSTSSRVVPADAAEHYSMRKTREERSTMSEVENVVLQQRPNFVQAGSYGGHEHVQPPVSLHELCCLRIEACDFYCKAEPCVHEELPKR